MRQLETYIVDPVSVLTGMCVEEAITSLASSSRADTFSKSVSQPIFTRNYSLGAGEVGFGEASFSISSILSSLNSVRISPLCNWKPFMCSVLVE